MLRARILARMSTAAALFAAFHPAFAAEKPLVELRVNAPGWITVYWEHTGNDVYQFRVQRETPAYTWIYQTHVGQHTDMGLTPDTEYRYRVCADYADEPECSEWLAARTMATPPPPVQANRTPPTVIAHESYHEPSRIKLWWRKNGDYDLVLVRWRNTCCSGEAQIEVHTPGAVGSRELVTPVAGQYVFVLKGCTRGLRGVANCGDWSASVEIATAPPGVARVECRPGTLKAGASRFAANGRAEYRFTPTDDAALGSCVESGTRVVRAMYDVIGSWNPTAQPTRWDTSGANTTETYTLTFGEDFSPERAPRRPLPPGAQTTATISFVARARCDRDPWLNPQAICQRTGHNMPPDIAAKWPALLMQPFPHSRGAIAAPDLARLRSAYNQVTGRLVGAAKPTLNPRLLAPKPK